MALLSPRPKILQIFFFFIVSFFFSFPKEVFGLCSSLTAYKSVPDIF